MVSYTRSLRLILQICIGVAIIIWLLRLADASKVLGIVFSINPAYIALATSLFIIASIMVALALYASLKALGLNPSIHRVIMASFGGQLLSDITPARSGYFLTPVILNKVENIPMGLGTVAVIVTGAINFLTKAILSLIALAYFLKLLPLSPIITNTALIGILFLIAGGLALLLLLWLRPGLKLNGKLEKLPMLGRGMSRIFQLIGTARSEGRSIISSSIHIAFLIALSVVANGAALYTISLALWQSSPSFIDFVFIASLASALTYIPITIAGLGVQDGSYVVILTLMGFPLEIAVAFALIARVLFTGIDIIGLYPLLKISKNNL